MGEHAEKQWYIHPGPSKGYDYGSETFQFPMIILWRSVLKSMNACIQDHLKTLIIAETYFNFQWLSYGGHAEKYEYIHPGPSKNYGYGERCFSFQCLP